jgi:hypothetical protein
MNKRTSMAMGLCLGMSMLASTPILAREANEAPRREDRREDRTPPGVPVASSDRRGSNRGRG